MAPSNSGRDWLYSSFRRKSLSRSPSVTSTSSSPPAAASPSPPAVEVAAKEEEEASPPPSLGFDRMKGEIGWEEEEEEKRRRKGDHQ